MLRNALENETYALLWMEKIIYLFNLVNKTYLIIYKIRSYISLQYWTTDYPYFISS